MQSSYDRMDEIDTKGFTNMGDAECLCPRHHPFFVFWAGMVHIRPVKISSLVLHAWVHWPSKKLHILWRGYDRRMCIGLVKAWRVFNGIDQDIRITTFRIDLGIHKDTVFGVEDDEVVDGWNIISSIPDLWK